MSRFYSIAIPPVPTVPVIRCSPSGLRHRPADARIRVELACGHDGLRAELLPVGSRAGCACCWLNTVRAEMGSAAA